MPNQYPFDSIVPPEGTFSHCLRDAMSKMHMADTPQTLGEHPESNNIGYEFNRMVTPADNILTRMIWGANLPYIRANESKKTDTTILCALWQVLSGKYSAKSDEYRYVNFTNEDTGTLDDLDFEPIELSPTIWTQAAHISLSNGSAEEFKVRHAINGKDLIICFERLVKQGNTVFSKGATYFVINTLGNRMALRLDSLSVEEEKVLLEQGKELLICPLEVIQLSDFAVMTPSEIVDWVQTRRYICPFMRVKISLAFPQGATYGNAYSLDELLHEYNKMIDERHKNRHRRHP